MTKDYSKLKELLDAQETFPCSFTLKFIGRNTQAFVSDVARFEGEYSSLRPGPRRLSSGGNHLALTYLFNAASSDEIIALLQRVSEIEDVQVIL